MLFQNIFSKKSSSSFLHSKTKQGILYSHIAVVINKAHLRDLLDAHVSYS